MTGRNIERKVCRNCWGMKVIELGASGDTKACPACKGEGFIKIIKRVDKYDLAKKRKENE